MLPLIVNISGIEFGCPIETLTPLATATVVPVSTIDDVEDNVVLFCHLTT